MKILLDMNLSPAWVPFLADAGFACSHWSDVGDARAPDSELMAWAREHGYLVFTHDMDFGTLLAQTRASGPSVLQVRVNNTLPEAIGHDVVRVLNLLRQELERGALVTIDKANTRVRVLPFSTDDEPA